MISPSSPPVLVYLPPSTVSISPPEDPTKMRVPSRFMAHALASSRPSSLPNLWVLKMTVPLPWRFCAARSRTSYVIWFMKPNRQLGYAQRRASDTQVHCDPTCDPITSSVEFTQPQPPPSRTHTRTFECPTLRTKRLRPTVRAVIVDSGAIEGRAGNHTGSEIPTDDGDGPIKAVHAPEDETWPLKRQIMHHIGQFKAQTGEGSAPHMHMPTQIQLNTVKMAEIDRPESDVHRLGCTVVTGDPIVVSAPNVWVQRSV